MTNGKRGGKGVTAKSSGKGFDPPRKGDKGASKGEGKKGAAKGSGKGKKGEAQHGPTSHPLPSQERHVVGAISVTQLEAEMLHSKGGSTKERREGVKQPLEAKGLYCEVKKHSEMGCAVVTFMDMALRDAVMTLVETKAAAMPADESEKNGEKRPTIQVDGVDVQCRKHLDKEKNEEIKTDIFVAWGRKTEKTNALAAQTIVEAMDQLAHEARGEAPAPVLLAQQLPNSMPQMQQQSLSQLLPQPMVNPLQQANDYAMYAWAQQAALAAQMQPPPSPLPSQPNAGVLETPPRPGHMRAEAQEFTPPPVQQQYFDPYATNEFDYYYGQNESVPKVSHALTITDPKTQQAIEVPELPKPVQAVAEKSFDLRGFEPQFDRKRAQIVDPKSGKPIDALGMYFEPPAKAKMEIKDPSTGQAISA